MYSRHAPHGHGPGRKRSGLSLPGQLPIVRYGALLLLALLLTLGWISRPAVASVAPGSSIVDVVQLNTQIDAASQHFLTTAITTAGSDGARALILEVNTPGGAIDAMQAIMTAELNSAVPIISYVTPSGAYAASAGALVTLAAHIAAMAPSTTIGASSPVSGDGSDLPATEKAKVESVLTTDITNIQQRYGRNAALAVRMITSAASYGDQQARTAGIINLTAGSVSDLLNQVSGRSVTLVGGRQVLLQTAGASAREIGQSPLDSLYGLLIDPNVVFLLFVIAMLGIYIEISHPGLIVPGVVGAIALLLFLFGAGSLSPNWAGLALMALACVLLILDVRLPTHGALTVGAVISLVVGALLFFNSGGPYQGVHVNPLVVYIMGILVGGLGFYVVTVVVRTRRAPVTTGTEGMIGERVTALTPLLPEGRVSYGGENWAAVLDPPTVTVDTGSELRIVSVDGLLLHVQLANTLPPAERNYIERV